MDAPRAAALAVAGLLALTNAAAALGGLCPAVNGTAQRTTCPAGWRCALKSGPIGACHFEYPPAMQPHREDCYGCMHGSGSLACEPNLPTVPMSNALPNVLIVGDSISHG